jgi:repressor LexA
VGKVTLKVLEVVEEFIKKNGYAPSLEEIAQRMGFASHSTAQYHLNKLKTSGHLLSKKEPSHKRDIHLSKISECLNIPLLGLVAAGQPIEAIENEDFFSVPLSLMKSNREYFCLKVEGDSMIDKHICDKDVVLIRKSSTCQDGDIVVAVVEDKATLKTFRKTKSRIELIPANQKYKPIIIDETKDFRIAGVYSGLFRFN